MRAPSARRSVTTSTPPCMACRPPTTTRAITSTPTASTPSRASGSRGTTPSARSGSGSTPRPARGTRRTSTRSPRRASPTRQVQRLNGRDLARNHLRGVRWDVQILLACLRGFRIGFVREDDIIRLHRLCDRGGHYGAGRHVLRPGERAVERVHVGPTGRYVIGKQGLIVHNEFETGAPDSLGDRKSTRL